MPCPKFASFGHPQKKALYCVEHVVSSDSTKFRYQMSPISDDACLMRYQMSPILDDACLMRDSHENCPTFAVVSLKLWLAGLLVYLLVSWFVGLFIGLLVFGVSAQNRAGHYTDPEGSLMMCRLSHSI